MPDTELWRRPATELATLIAEGQVSSREVVEAHLERIDEVNGRLNAITVLRADDARAEADAADASEPSGPLHGVPVTIKENVDQIGYATTQGLAAFADAYPTHDAVTVTRITAAGAIPIGRTNMPELGLRVSTDNSFRGLTRNPWHPHHTAGGSSGGEGAAIASGMSPLGIGNDIGGSIRNPALCSGVLGLKPGFGRVPRVSSVPPEDPGISGQLMSVEGPLARTVADLRLAFEVLAGPSRRDPKVAPAPLTGPCVPRRVGVVRCVPGVDIDPGGLAAIDTAARALADAGWELHEIEAPELERVADVWVHLLAFDVADTAPLLEGIMGEAEMVGLQALVDAVRADFPPQLVLAERHRLQRRWSAMFEDTPVVLGPGWTKPPFLHGADIVDGHQLDVIGERLGFVVPGNALGLPVLAMATSVHDGLPAGVQIYADQWREDLCLEAGAVIEAAVGTLGPIDPTWD